MHAVIVVTLIIAMEKPLTRAAAQKCKKEESAAANTIFHNIKFPINKAFYIAYNVCVLGSDLSTYNYSDQLGLNQMTCWKFRKRIQNCITKLEYTEKNKIQNILLSEYK